MENLITNIEIDEIAESVVVDFSKKQSINSCVDIEGLATEYIGLNVVYENMVEKDLDKLGFLSDGKYRLRVKQGDKITKKVYPANTIVIDASLLKISESGRRRFTIAHELGHILIERLSSQMPIPRFSTEYDSERDYDLNDFKDRFNLAEIQANTMGAALLMPQFLIKKAITNYAGGKRLPIYGQNVLKHREKVIVRKMADSLGVSMTALIIRLKHLNYFKQHEMSEYLASELRLGVSDSEKQYNS